MASDGYSWSGTLDDTDIQSLYAACQSLRFSGKLELRDGTHKAEVTFVGGEPIEIDGGDTQKIALWNKGTFKAVQSIPNLAGELTGQREMEGSLAVTKASQLWAWISEYRLTCEIDLERPGSKALVSFSNGHAESAQVNGMPELAALARVSSWTDGQFRVRLKPLFVDGVIPHAPPMPEGAPPAGRHFDISRSIPMDLKLKAAATAGMPQFGAARSTVTPPLGELAMQTPGPGRDSEATRENPRQALAADALKKKRNPFDPPNAPGVAAPIEPSGAHEKADPTFLVGGKKSRLPWILSAAAIAIAGGLGALYHFHMPPFSPPPQPIVEPTPSGATTAPSGATTAPSGAATEASGATTAPTGATTAPSGATTPPSGATTAPSGATTAPSGATVSPTGATTKPEPKVETKAESKKDKAEKAEKELVAKARLLLIEGHSHTALDQLRKAIKMAPKDAQLKVYEQQALGKLGKAELQLEGKGAAVVDGHKFASPKKLKVMAGPHTIDAGDGEDEVTLKRGEKRRVKVKR
jgi:hypothetical protein